jgi:hypothetical protein
MFSRSMFLAILFSMFSLCQLALGRLIVFRTYTQYSCTVLYLQHANHTVRRRKPKTKSSPVELKPKNPINPDALNDWKTTLKHRHKTNHRHLSDNDRSEHVWKTDGSHSLRTTRARAAELAEASVRAAELADVAAPQFSQSATLKSLEPLFWYFKSVCESDAPCPGFRCLVDTCSVTLHLCVSDVKCISKIIPTMLGQPMVLSVFLEDSKLNEH